jgi:5-methyltetrahydropteroyltriglutamate--homocysteine methyltransferase
MGWSRQLRALAAVPFSAPERPDGSACRPSMRTVCSLPFESEMDILLHNHSSYPRIGDRPAQQRLRRAYAARERGEIDMAEFTLIERTQIDEVIHEQEQAGVDVVTDGQIRWYDPISHLMAALDGVRINGLLRYFDTNFYFRQPVVTAAIRRRGPILRDDFTRACRAARRRVKPVLPGPYTLARLSVIGSAAYGSVPALAHALSEVMTAEVRDLAAAGAEYIQIEEPAILLHGEDIRLLRQLLEPLWTARGTAQLVIATYFGDAEPLYAQLHSLPADVIALDFTYSSNLMDLVAASGASKVLGLGLVDGRNTRLERPETVAHQIEALLKRYTFDTIHVLPSCGLEHLPRNSARAKLALLANARRLVQGRE